MPNLKDNLVTVFCFYFMVGFFLRFIFISALVHEHVCVRMGGGAETPIRTHQTPWS